MIKYMHRHEFGKIQSRLFAVYFLIQGITAVGQLLVYCYMKEDIAKLSQQDIFLVSCFFLVVRLSRLLEGIVLKCTA